MDSKLPEEVHESVAALRQAKPEDERRENNAQHFLNEDDDFHLVEHRELSPDLVAMEAATPLGRKVMGILYHIVDGILRVKDQSLLRGHTTGHSPNTTENGEIEENGSLFGELEFQEGFWIDGGRKCKYRSQGASNKGHKTPKLGHLFFRKLVHIPRCKGVGHFYPPLEQMP